MAGRGSSTTGRRADRLPAGRRRRRQRPRRAGLGPPRSRPPGTGPAAAGDRRGVGARARPARPHADQLRRVPWNGPYYQRLGFRVLDDAPADARPAPPPRARGRSRPGPPAPRRDAPARRPAHDRPRAVRPRGRDPRRLMGGLRPRRGGRRPPARPGVAAAVFPCGPEREIYNNALLDRDLGPAERAAAIDTMEAAYRSAGVGRYAAWVHESDEGMRAALTGRGYGVDESTRAMAMALDDLPPATPRPSSSSRRPTGSSTCGSSACSPGLLGGADPRAFHVLVARLRRRERRDRDGLRPRRRLRDLQRDHARAGAAARARHGAHRAPRCTPPRSAAARPRACSPRRWPSGSTRPSASATSGRILEFVPRLG